MTVLVLQLYHHPHTPVYQWLKTVVVTIGNCCKVDVSSLKEKSGEFFNTHIRIITQLFYRVENVFANI